MSAAQVIPDEARRTYLGSHDTAAIFGMHPFLKPMNIYMNKVGMSAERGTTEVMEWGLRNQPAILAKFAERMKFDLEPERFIRHPTLEWFGGTPDATIAGFKAGVDAKNIGFNRGEWGEDGTDQIPEYVAIQCHHFMTLMDYERWYVAVLFGGCHFRVFQVERDTEISDMILEADAEFWRDHVLADVPPPVDDTFAWRKYIDRKFPRADNPAREATPEEAALMHSYRREKAKLKRRESRVAKLENQLRLAIGDSLGLYSDIGKVSNNVCKPSIGVDVKRLREEMPLVAAQYEKIGEPYRKFYSKFQEEEE